MQVRYNKAQAQYAARVLLQYNRGPWDFERNKSDDEVNEAIAADIEVTLVSYAKEFIAARQDHQYSYVSTGGFLILFEVQRDSGSSEEYLRATVLIDPFIMILDYSIEHDQQVTVDF